VVSVRNDPELTDLLFSEIPRVVEVHENGKVLPMSVAGGIPMMGLNDMILWGVLFTGTVTDLLCGKLYNSVNFSVMGGGLIACLLQDPPSLISTLVAVAYALLIFFPLYRLKVIAAGDVKLLMAYGAWAQPQRVVQVALLSILLAAAVGGVILVRRLGLVGGVKSLINHVKPHATRFSNRMPFAPSLLCAHALILIGEMKQWV